MADCVLGGQVYELQLYGVTIGGQSPYKIMNSFITGQSFTFKGMM